MEKLEVEEMDEVPMVEGDPTPGRTPASGSPLEGTPVPRIPAGRNPGSPLRSTPVANQYKYQPSQSFCGTHKDPTQKSPNRLALEGDPEGKSQRTLQATGAEGREAQPARIGESYPPRREPSPNTASNKKRRFQTQVRPILTLETPNSETGVNFPTTAPGGDASTREKAKDAQTYDMEDRDSEPEHDKEASDGAARAESPMIAHLHHMFSERLDAMQSMVQRLLGVAPPIRKSNPDSYADTPFTNEITLIEMPRKFSFHCIKAYDSTT
ncbi:hypothetical protein F2Q70_00003768 [Brassica cretica]|uniref:Uncharacterized protein n=1 Tax=Brassica cretica TaxID=69181 RepID=A0A8S9IR95_BRACR|nr:hypothetical protein F2Q70_00003768 [Brassica cretica]